MKKFTKLLISGAMIALLSTGLTLGHIYRNEIKDFFTGVFAKAETPSKPTGEEIKGFKFSGNKITGYTGTEVNLQSLPNSYSKTDELIESFDSTYADLSENEEMIEKLMNHSFNCQPQGKDKFYCSDLYSWEEQISVLFEDEDIENIPLKFEILKTTYYEGDEFKVTAIGDRAFEGNTIITDIVIPDYITEIGSGAFDSCSSLINVTLNKNINSLEMSTFCGCTNLENINIENITRFDNYVFSGCKSLKNVTLNENLKEISSNLFQNTGLTSIKIPSSVERIKMMAFSGCSNLTEITIEEGVKELDSSFIEGTAVTKLELPSSIVFSDYISFSNDNLEVVKFNMDLSMTQLSNFLYSNNCQVFVKSEIEKECFTDENVNNFAQYNGRIFSLEEYTGEKVQRTGLITDYRFNTPNSSVEVSRYLGTSTILTLPDIVRYEYETLLEQTLSSKEEFDTFYEEHKNLLCYEISYMSTLLNSGGLFETINELKTYIDENYSTTTNLFPMDVKAQNLYVYESDVGIKVESIDHRAFENNTTIEEVILGDTYTLINEYAFLNCTNLKKVVLGKNFETIHDNTFEGTTEDLKIIIEANKVLNILWSKSTPDIAGKVYVQDELYDAYITSEGWSGISSQIHRMSEL